MPKWPQIHPSIIYKNKGLYTTSAIPAQTIIISTYLKDTLSFNKLPSEIQNLSIDQNMKLTLFVVILQNVQNVQMEDEISNWLKSDSSGFSQFS